VSVVVILLMFLAVIAMVKKVDEDRLSNAILASDSLSSGLQDQTATQQIVVLRRIGRVLRCPIASTVQPRVSNETCERLGDECCR
jgi:hypothetical protein